jgi:hypothetical protein
MLIFQLGSSGAPISITDVLVSLYILHRVIRSIQHGLDFQAPYALPAGFAIEIASVSFTPPEKPLCLGHHQHSPRDLRA